jgi:hypothetical protein
MRNPFYFAYLGIGVVALIAIVALVFSVIAFMRISIRQEKRNEFFDLISTIPTKGRIRVLHDEEVRVRVAPGETKVVAWFNVSKNNKCIPRDREFPLTLITSVSKTEAALDVSQGIVSYVGRNSGFSISELDISTESRLTFSLADMLNSGNHDIVITNGSSVPLVVSHIRVTTGSAAPLNTSSAEVYTPELDVVSEEVMIDDSFENEI